MVLFLSVTAFLLSFAAIFVGAEALRRINGQNEEFLKAYVKQILVDLDRKDKEMALLRKDIEDIKRARQANLDILRQLEQDVKRKRETENENEQCATEPVDKYGNFIPSSAAPGKQIVA